MQTLAALQQRIATIEQLDAVVSTMKALSQINIRQSERAAHASRLYRRMIELALVGVVGEAAAIASVPETQARPGEQCEGLIVFGSDQGLCGKFNVDVIANAGAVVNEVLETGACLRTLVVGLRIERGLDDLGAPAEHVLQMPGSAERIAATVQQLVQHLERWQSEGVQRVRVVHNRLNSGTRFETVIQSLLPLDIPAVAARSGRWPGRGRPLYSIRRPVLLAAIVRQYFFVLLFGACAESFASESGARLAAMHAAQKMLEVKRTVLGSTFRHQRQERITAEMLDVVAGFEAGLQPSPARI